MLPAPRQKFLMKATASVIACARHQFVHGASRPIQMNFAWQSWPFGQERPKGGRAGVCEAEKLPKIVPLYVILLPIKD